MKSAAAFAIATIAVATVSVSAAETSNTLRKRGGASSAQHSKQKQENIVQSSSRRAPLLQRRRIQSINKKKRHLQTATATTTTTAAAATSCSFCPSGLTDPTIVLPVEDATTCLQAQEYAATLSTDDAICSTVKLAEELCCPSSIYDLGVANTDFSTLVSLVDAAGLGDVLKGEGTYTLFAPTNDAFEVALGTMPDGFLEYLLLPENVGTLQSILGYHALNTTLFASDLVSGYVDTMNGESVMISVAEDGSVMVNDAHVAIADIAASNGVIHVVDAVLVPPSIEEALAAAATEALAEATATTTATTTAAPESSSSETTTTAAAATASTEEICSCSPTSYTFTLTLTQNCTDNTIQDNSGIFATDCFLGTLVATSNSDTTDSRSTTTTTEERAFTAQEFEAFQRTITDDTSVEIISVSFIEFDTSGEFIVLSQDDTYLSTSLSNGDTVTFTSISADLDPDVPASEQSDLIPGGVMVTIKAKYTDEETGEDLLVINRVAWNYVMECDVETIAVGEYLAWITAVSFVDQSIIIIICFSWVPTLIPLM